MPDADIPDQVPPPPAVHPGTPARNRVLVGGTGLGLIALVVVLLTLPAGDSGIKVAPAEGLRSSAGGVTPPAAPAAPPSAPTTVQPPVAATSKIAPPQPPPPPPPPPPTPTTAAIVATALPRGATMRLDGKVVSRRRFAVGAGKHILDASQTGFVPRTDTVQLKAGEQFAWSPRLMPAPQTRTAGSGVPPKAAPPAAEAVSRRSGADEAACRQSVASASWHDAFGPCLRAAQVGSIAAQRSVAAMFQHGNGVTRSDDSAAHWFGQAARGGDGESMYQLAIAYDRGRGLKKDQAAALDWYSRAGNAGQGDAAFAVGAAYEKGHLGAAKDKTKALEWYRKAAAQGNKDAANKVRDLSR